MVVPTIVVTKELNPGARSDEVMNLQKLLAKDPSIYPEGIVSGFYGPKTVVAVRKFQAKYGLPQVGRVGPATMAKINEVLGSVSTPVVAPSTPMVAPTTSSSNNNDLTKQIENQIKAIQSQISTLTAPNVPVAPVQPAPAPTTTSTGDLTKQIEAQIKAIQDQIKALQ